MKQEIIEWHKNIRNNSEGRNIYPNGKLADFLQNLISSGKTIVSVVVLGYESWPFSGSVSEADRVIIIINSDK